MRLVDVNQVIGRARPDFAATMAPPLRASSSRVDARLETVPLAGPNSPRLFGREHPCSQNTSHHSAIPSAAIAGIISSHQAHVLAATAARLDRHFVCAHEV